MPKLSVKDVVLKFSKGWNLKFEPETKIYYTWEKTRRAPWFSYIREPKESYVLIDYSPDDKQWIVGYIFGRVGEKFGVINDITGAFKIRPDFSFTKYKKIDKKRYKSLTEERMKIYY